MIILKSIIVYTAPLLYLHQISNLMECMGVCYPVHVCDQIRSTVFLIESEVLVSKMNILFFKKFDFLLKKKRDRI